MEALYLACTSRDVKIYVDLVWELFISLWVDFLKLINNSLRKYKRN